MIRNCCVFKKCASLKCRLLPTSKQFNARTSFVLRKKVITLREHYCILQNPTRILNYDANTSKAHSNQILLYNEELYTYLCV